MFLSALQPYVVFIIIAVVLLQYAFAVFCLLKLAYMDIDKKYYILWNLFILIVFFIGGIVFLVYYSKHPELRISKDVVVPQENNEVAEKQEQKAEEEKNETAKEQTENEEQPKSDEE